MNCVSRWWFRIGGDPFHMANIVFHYIYRRLLTIPVRSTFSNGAMRPQSQKSSKNGSIWFRMNPINGLKLIGMMMPEENTRMNLDIFLPNMESNTNQQLPIRHSQTA